LIIIISKKRIVVSTEGVVNSSYFDSERFKRLILPRRARRARRKD